MVKKVSLMISILILLLLAVPVGARAADWVAYGSDAEGKHYYDRSSVVQETGIVKVLTTIVYTSEGKKLYLAKRQAVGMSNAGLDRLHYRTVRYDINCFSDKKEFCTLEVRELSRDGKTLDYAKAGGYKDWNEIPEGSPLDQLHKTICPARR